MDQSWLECGLYVSTMLGEDSHSQNPGILSTLGSVQVSFFTRIYILWLIGLCNRDICCPVHLTTRGTWCSFRSCTSFTWNVSWRSFRDLVSHTRVFDCFECPVPFDLLRDEWFI